MSATLPEFLYNLFNNKLGSDTAKLSLSERDRQEKELLSQARHRIILIDSEIIDYIDRIKEFLKNKRVLVICNSVGRAQKMYNLLKQSAKKPLLLHGRFITKDRELIEKSISGADLLVGTQAIEVSLNISFDVLFTEPAPLDALLQRFGRVNRFNEANRPVNVYVFKRGSESDEYIYDISRVQRTMGLLSNNLILSNKLAQTLVEETYKEGYSLKEQREYEDTLKDFNWIMDQLPVFDESEFKEEFFELIKSVEVIPIKFQQKYLQLKKDKKFFDCIGYIVPISIKQFCYLNKEGRINKVRNDIFINASYNSELGLDLKKKEVINENII